MSREIITLEDHFLTAIAVQAPHRSITAALDCLDEGAARAVCTIVEALQGGCSPEAANSLILASGFLLRRAADQMPGWARHSAEIALAAAETSDRAGHKLVEALAVRGWLETSRLFVDEDSLDNESTD